MISEERFNWMQLYLLQLKNNPHPVPSEAKPFLDEIESILEDLIGEHENYRNLVSDLREIGDVHIQRCVDKYEA